MVKFILVPLQNVGRPIQPVIMVNGPAADGPLAFKLTRKCYALDAKDFLAHTDPFGFLILPPPAFSHRRRQRVRSIHIRRRQVTEPLDDGQRCVGWWGIVVGHRCTRPFQHQHLRKRRQVFIPHAPFDPGDGWVYVGWIRACGGRYFCMLSQVLWSAVIRACKCHGKTCGDGACCLRRCGTVMLFKTIFWGGW